MNRPAHRTNRVVSNLHRVALSPQVMWQATRDPIQEALQTVVITADLKAAAHKVEPMVSSKAASKVLAGKPVVVMTPLPIWQRDAAR